MPGLRLKSKCRRKKARVKRELREATEKLKKIRKEQREAEAVVTAMEQMRVYSLEMLGHGKKVAGISLTTKRACRYYKLFGKLPN